MACCRGRLAVNILTIPAAIVCDLLLPNYRSSAIEHYLPVDIGMTQAPLNTDVGIQGSASILLLAVASICNIDTIYSMANIKHTCSDGLACVDTGGVGGECRSTTVFGGAGR